VLKNSHIVLAVILVLGAILVTGCSTAPRAKNGDTVQVHYTGKLKDGTVFDSSVGREPLEFKLGAGQMIPGFEKAVLGMKVGEKKTVTIPVNEAYGPRRADRMLEVPREELPKDITVRVGEELGMMQPNGKIAMVIISSVSDNTVTIDTNHFLAGKDLTFEIELVTIK
jgi:FKBP-type peptidyl-prolyl cis-trans isomerase 2